jgi:dTDP-4-amino-4,6-dideoxygalactose transaminase
MEKPMNIQMADLYGQYLKIKEEVDAAMAEVIRSTIFIKGGKVTEFERHLAEYQQAEVIACGNGTDALQIAFMALGLAPGDEVITSPFTFVATAEVLALLGLRPVFADVDPADFNLSPALTAAAITSRTRALLPVHLFGQNAPMEELLALAQKHGLHVVEDAAQSIGSDYLFSNGEIHRSGTLGIIGCTSFFPSKTLGAFGDGGALFTRDGEMATQIRSIANHGQRIRYHYERIGMNSRLDSLQAALLDVKLRHLDAYVAARQKAADYYDVHLQGVGDLLLPERRPWSTHSFHQYTLRTSRRDALQAFLKERGVPAMVYYPKPLHLHEAYHYLGYGPGDFPVSEKLAQTVLSLPMHTELDEAQLEYITRSVKDFFKS